MQALDAMVQRIYPPGTVIVQDQEALPNSQRFWLIRDQAGNLRWLLPRSAQAAYRILETWTPHDLSSRVKWQVILAAYRRGWLGKLPGVSTLGLLPDTASSWEHLHWRNPKPPVTAAYFGRPGVLCKAVVFLLDEQQGQPPTVAKVPVGESAGPNILHEAAILKGVNGTHADAGPSLIFEDQQNTLTLQAFIEGVPLGSKFSAAHSHYLAGLLVPDRKTSILEQAADLKQRFELQGLASTERELVHQQLQTLQSETLLPAVWQHGDFAPWNIRQSATGQVFAIDWEEAHVPGLPLYDVIHFHFIQCFLSGKNCQILPDLLKDPNVRLYLHAMNISTYLAREIFRFYLLDYWCRRLQQGEPDAICKFYQVMRPLLEHLS